MPQAILKYDRCDFKYLPAILIVSHSETPSLFSNVPFRTLNYITNVTSVFFFSILTNIVLGKNNQKKKS